MPGLDLSQLSGNWKKLQGQLQAEKKPQTASHAGNGVKRKRLINETEKARSEKKKKKAKLTERTRQARGRPLRMGLGTSKPEPTLSRPTHQSSGKDDGPISSLPDGHSNAQSDHINSGLHSTNRVGKYISLDCEMVGTGLPPHTDNVLARVSVVNFHGEQLYDSYVLPSPGLIVEDYRTFVSGIQPHHLKPGYARPFVEVQTDVAHLLHARILVGHALRNDLDVLMLSHPKRDVRDTARYPKFRKQHHGTPALRLLAREVLGLEIQGGEHSSLEDARAAMLLFRKEKIGFEEETRRKFGARRVQRQEGVKKKGGGGVHGSSFDDDVDESDDLDVLDGEEDLDDLSDADAEAEEDKQTAPRTRKKKAKKKKRTKRK